MVLNFYMLNYIFSAFNVFLHSPVDILDEINPSFLDYIFFQSYKTREKWEEVFQFVFLHL